VGMLLDKVPPQNIEAEQSVLGSMLLDRDAVIKASEILQPEDFYRQAHQAIYRAILALMDRSEAVDIITVSEELRQQKLLAEVGGVTYLTTLANAVPTAANVEHYARIVEEKAVLRRMINVATEVVRRAYAEEEEVETLLDHAQQQMFDLTQRRRRRTYASMRDILLETYEYIESLHRNKGEIIGVPSGFKDLDQLTSGFHPSEFIVLAARPSQGKSTILLNMAAHAAIYHRIPTAIFSLEMSRIQIAQRLLCAEARINSHRLRTGYLGDEDWPKLSTALGRLSEAPLWIDDTPNIAVMELRARARRLKAEHNIGLLLIDYLQLMHMKGQAENRQQEIAAISRSLKALAREIDCPVIAASQLSRAVEQRQDRRPQLSDLRESGAIEQDADVVLFIHHNPENAENVVDLILAKQRNGPTGTVQLVFLKEYGRFVNLEGKYVA